MNKGYLYIHNIEIKETEDKAFLEAMIDDNGISKTMQYTVDIKYRDFLTYERSDAFVLALLYYAMINSYDLAWDIPCDEKLIYQLKTYFIPVYGKELPFMNTICLSGPTTKVKLDQVGGVATGISNGVDSCYTMKKYLEDVEQQFKLTHLIFTNWFLTDFSEENKKDFMESYMEKLPEQTKSLGLDFIFVDFKIDEYFSVGHIKDKERGIIQDVGLHTLKYCSIALALQKLISIYYFSGALSPSDFSFKEDDMAYHDIFTLPLISSAVQFYSTGMEVTRLEKVEYIADWEYAQKNLQVCMLDNKCNCGRCSKCIRTMGELYTCGKLDLYKERFPVEDFNNNLSKRFAKILVQASRKHIFEVEIISEQKKRDVSIPAGAYFLFPFYSLYERLRLAFREMKFARRIYRYLNLDLKIYGKRTYSKYLDDEK